MINNSEYVTELVKILDEDYKVAILCNRKLLILKDKRNSTKVKKIVDEYNNTGKLNYEILRKLGRNN
ncbi:hypothetical protein [Tenacibaculum aiptasiae]|uniref:hypothetical protein n=1 Tax=Tenacibaculum aiptasiae TaxID=426481 RepID=UPI0023314301|nr:hypothetical protein [Tenacibaculum aiptasiae]